MIQQDNYPADLFAFLSRATTPFHAVATAADFLSRQGFQRLRESDPWPKRGPGAYFVVRSDATLIAFTLNRPAGEDGLCFRMAGAHTDSPCLKIKPNPMQLRHGCVQLGVEVYGGALLAPWFDRDLSLAGRVVWRQQGGALRSNLIDFRRPVAVIPSLAIHLDREVNSSRNINKQNDLVPLVMLGADEHLPDFTALLTEELRREEPDAVGIEVLAGDYFLYDTQPPARVGFNGDFLTASRLDNLLSCHTLLLALVESAGQRDCLVILNDHEEVGSVSTTGAQGPFLRSVLERLPPDPEQRQMCIGRSLFVSVDNAHAVHPNFAGKHDPEHQPLLNRGPVIKVNASQRYATSGLTAGLFRSFCVKAGVPCQQFVMRNDLACGSTIGPLTAAEIGIPTVDVGVPQLAMHSIRETIGQLDGWYLLKAMTTFFTEPDEAIRSPESAC